MNTENEPVINNWYKHQEDHLHFCIKDIDEQKGVLDVQHADGDLDTIEIDSWYELDMELAAEPEFWADTMDDIDDSYDPTIGSDDLPNGVVMISRAQPERQQPDAIDEKIMLQEWENEELAALSDAG